MLRHIQLRRRLNNGRAMTIYRIISTATMCIACRTTLLSRHGNHNKINVQRSNANYVYVTVNYSSLYCTPLALRRFYRSNAYSRYTTRYLRLINGVIRRNASSALRTMKTLSR